jgi:hypothetical protein
MFTHGNVKRQCFIVSVKETANTEPGMVLGHNQWRENKRSRSGILRILGETINSITNK